MKKYIGLSIIAAVLLGLILFLNGQSNESKTPQMGSGVMSDDAIAKLQQLRQLELEAMDVNYRAKITALRRISRKDTLVVRDTVYVGVYHFPY